MTRLRILLADDHPIYRKGLVRLLSECSEFEVVGEADNAVDVVSMAQSLSPDICLLDISMPGDGLVAANKIVRLPSLPKVIMLTVAEQHAGVIEALKAGVSGYVLKGVGGEELVNIIKGVSSGQPYVAPSLGAKVLASVSLDDEREPRIGRDWKLSEREAQILKGVAKGMSNRDIGQSLELSERTIKHYITPLFQKLNVKNRVEAALKAQKFWGSVEN